MNAPATLLPRRTVAELLARRRLGLAGALDAETLATADRIVADVRQAGEPALREHAERLGDRLPSDILVFERRDLARALSGLDRGTRELLERSVSRIEAFARAQRAALADVVVPVLGGRAGHRWMPVSRAGCYVPGGRHPLPSSALMSAVPARVAGVGEVWLAGPRPQPVTLAAAAIAGADAFVNAGGAQVIAALAYGAGAVPACDVVVGPGNRFVAAAKRCVSGDVGIDTIAGPSELVVVADGASDPAWIAADLLAQAEHDVDALPILISVDASLAERVERELARQLTDLPTAGTARAALAGGGFVACASWREVIDACDALAPEHLQLSCGDAARLAAQFRHYGALFVGEASAEVFADYGVGPNHTLPTGGGSRFASGLSVSNFLVARTWLEIDDGDSSAAMARDAAAFARLEGLEAHARAAERRGGRITSFALRSG